MTLRTIRSGSESPAVCKDYGLDHIQYSVFSGPLDSTRRNEMFARLDHTLGNNEGKVLMLQICEKDVAAKREIVRIIDLE